MQAMERRFVAGVLLWGALFAMIGNALHPFFPLRMPTEEFLAGVADASATWGFLHLSLVLAVVLIAAGVVMVSQRLTGTPGEALGRFAVVLALLGGGVFVLWQGVLDGAVFPALASEFATAADTSAVLATAAGMLAMENGLAALSILLFNGAAVLAFGLALNRARAFARTPRWTLIVAGAAAMAVGTMMFVGVGDAVTFWLFRLAGLVETLALLWLAIDLFRGSALVAEPIAAPAERPAPSPSG